MAIHYRTPREKAENARVISAGRFLRKIPYVVGMPYHLIEVKGKQEIEKAIQDLKVYGEKDCWLWTGQFQKQARKPRKYGNHSNYEYPVVKVMQENGTERYYPARRYAFYLMFGHFPLSHEIVKNICGEPKCVNPDPKHNIITTREDWRAEVAMAEAKQIVKTDKPAEQLARELKQRESQTVRVLPSQPISEEEAMRKLTEEWGEPADAVPASEEEFLEKFKEKE